MAVTNRNAGPLIGDRKPFHNHNMTFRGVTWTGDFGHLPYEWRNKFFADRPKYIVVSYSTPIGWVPKDSDEWVIPEVYYSATTSRHQSILRRWAK
jgi:hypothetical protein